MALELVITDRTRAPRWLRSASRGHLVRYVVSIGSERRHEERPPHGLSFCRGRVIRLNFDDCETEVEYHGGAGDDRPHARYYGPTLTDIERLLRFYDSVDMEQDGYVLVHCYAGVSRSTAAAYILYASKWGQDRAQEAAEYVYSQQNCHKASNQGCANPNRLMVKHASKLLGWDLLTPLDAWDDEFFDQPYKK